MPSPDHAPLKASSPSGQTGDGPDVDGYDEMICALNLADDLALEAPQDPPLSKANSPTGSSSSRLTRPDPPPAFLAHPPSAPGSRSPSPKPDSAPLPAPPTRFPSSFAAGKKSAARLAAAQAAQAAGKAAIHRPGKVGRLPAGPKKKAPAGWNSDDDEESEDEDEKDEDEEEEEEEEDERLTRHRQTNAHLLAEAHADRGFQNRGSMLSPLSQTHSIYSTGNVSQVGMSQHHGYDRDSSRPVSTSGSQSELAHFPSAASRREMPSVLREQPADSVDTAGMRPAFSQHGLLHRVMQERQGRSAKSIQEAAHYTGEPLVQVAHKPPPPHSGLLGAIASHERDRKRDGGMGAALTERARGQAARQREADEMQRQSMMLMGGGMGYGMVGGYPGMVPMMYNPQMMGAGGMVPNQAAYEQMMGAGGMVPNQAAYEQMMFQQHQMQMQQQAMMVAQQQAYMNPYYGVGAGGAPAGPMMNPMMAGGGMMSAHQSMYGGLSGLGSSNYLSGMAGGAGSTPGSHGGPSHATSPLSPNHPQQTSSNR